MHDPFFSIIMAFCLFAFGVWLGIKVEDGRLLQQQASVTVHATPSPTPTP